MRLILLAALLCLSAACASNKPGWALAYQDCLRQQGAGPGREVIMRLDGGRFVYARHYCRAVADYATQ